jgi:hypothetical protein
MNKEEGYIDQLVELIPQYLEFNNDPMFYGHISGSDKKVKNKKQLEDNLKKDFHFRWTFWI